MIIHELACLSIPHSVRRSTDTFIR